MAKVKLNMQEVITKMFKQHGISDDEVQTIMDSGDPDSDEVEVEEDIANKLGTNLLTVESAKANPDVRKAIIAESLNGFDTLGDQLIQEYQIPDDKLAEIKSAKTTHAKIKAITKTIADLQAAKAGTAGKDASAAEKTIKELNEQLATLKDAHKKELDRLNEGFQTERVGSKVADIYNSLDYALADVPKETAIAAAKGVMQRVEETEGVVYKLTEEGLTLMKKDGTPYFDPATNKPVAPKDYIQRHLQTNKLLKISDGNKNTPPPRRAVSQNGGQEKQIRVVNASLLDEAIEANPPQE